MKRIHVTGKLLENIEEVKKEFDIIYHFIINYIIGAVIMIGGYCIFLPPTFEIINTLLIEVLTADFAFTYIENKDFLKRKEAAKKFLNNFATSLKKENVFVNEDSLINPTILIRDKRILTVNKPAKIENVNYIWLSGKLDTICVLRERAVNQGHRNVSYSIDLFEEEDMDLLPIKPKKFVRAKGEFKS